MAEFGWGITEPLANRARAELNEIPEERASAIAGVQELMETRPDIEYLRSDEAFILRFLRARKFKVEEAFRLFARYFEYRQTNKNLFKKFEASESGIKDALLDGLPGVLPGTDHRGRRIVVLYSANWDNTRYGLAAIYRAILLTLEKLIDDESSQINGFVVIVDWSEFTFKQSSWLNPRILKLMIEGLQDCFPARFTAIHFVNQPWYIEAVFKMLKPFLKEKNHNKIVMHGINLMTLHQQVRKEALPAELGGTQAPYNNQSWAHTLLGDETFSFGHRHIYWPSRTPPPHKPAASRSETFPLDQFSNREEDPTKKGTYLDEEFFLID
ncbi:hypothetical protein ACOMHN_014928 [Nucella lapillus]